MKQRHETLWSTHVWRRVAIGLVYLLSCLGPVSEVLAQETLVVVSSQSSPYTQAADACEKQLDQAGIAYRRVMLENLKPEQITGAVGRIIAIGALASSALVQDLPPHVSLYYCMTPSPDQLGLTTRANTSGISTEISSESQLDLIVESKIKVKRVGVLYRKNSVISSQAFDEIERALPSDWVLIAVDLDEVVSASNGIKQLLDQKIDLIWTIPDPSVYNGSTVKALLLESLRKKVPVFGFSQGLVRAGAAFGFGIEPNEQGTRLAKLLINESADQHLNAHPHLAINQIVADRINLRFPNGFLRDASRVFDQD